MRGRIGGEEALATEKLAHGLVADLGFQINLELFLGAQITAFLFGAFVGGFGCVATAHVFSFFEPPGAGMVPVALRAPYTMPAPSTL